MPEFSDVGNDPKDVPANELVKAFQGKDFPLRKNEMKEAARNNNAPDTIIQAIDLLPDREYNSPVDVEKEYGNIT